MVWFTLKRFGFIHPIRVMNTLFDAPWLVDLATEMPPQQRLQRLIGGLRAHFCCGAVALLRLEEGHLRPMAVDGLVDRHASAPLADGLLA